MGFAGALHFVIPHDYQRIVPRALPAGWARPLVYGSGVAEVTGAVLLVVPRTRRVGAVVLATLIAVVFPANVQMALDGGLRGAGFPLGSPVVAWLRLPLQAPLFLWALSHARSRSRVRAQR